MVLTVVFVIEMMKENGKNIKIFSFSFFSLENLSFFLKAYFRFYI